MALQVTPLGQPIAPPLRACFHWSLRVFSLLGLGLVVVVLVVIWVRELPFLSSLSRMLPLIILGLVAATTFQSLMLYITSRWAAARILLDGLYAGSKSGARVVVPWSSIRSMTATQVGGLPMLAVESSASKKTLYVNLLGQDHSELRRQLHAAAGRDDLWTQ
jgi:hypothetical protein